MRNIFRKPQSLWKFHKKLPFQSLSIKNKNKTNKIPYITGNSHEGCDVNAATHTLLGKETQKTFHNISSSTLG